MCLAICMFFLRNVYLGLLVFNFFILSYMNWLCILEINALFFLHLQIFSLTEGCFFILFMVSFAVKELLSLIRPHLFIFGFYFYYFRRWVKKGFLLSVLPVFSSESYIVSGLTFRSLIHLEFIFVYGVREYSNFIQFMCNCSVFPALIIEKTPLYILASFVID